MHLKFEDNDLKLLIDDIILSNELDSNKYIYAHTIYNSNEMLYK